MHPDVIRLSIQWMKDQTTTTEAMEQLKVKQVSQAVYKMGIALRAAWRKGMLGK